MAGDKTSILLSDVSIEGDLVEKDKIILDAKVSGDIKAEDIETFHNSNIKGNINSKNASLGGKMKGNVSSDKIKIKKTLKKLKKKLKKRNCLQKKSFEKLKIEL